MGCGCHSRHVSNQVVRPQELGPKAQQADARVLRGQALFQQGKLDEAMKEYNATIQAWPDHARAYLERGTLRYSVKKWDDALTDFSMAIKLQNSYLMAYLMRAKAHLMLAHYDDALRDCFEAGRIDPDNAQVRSLKADIRRVGLEQQQRRQQQQQQAAAATQQQQQPGAAQTPTRTASTSEDDDPFVGLDTPKGWSVTQTKLCMVCMDASRGCRLRPCMHAALCAHCAEDLKSRSFGCPVCNQRIESVERGEFMQTFTVEDGAAMLASATAALGLSQSPTKTSPAARRLLFVSGGSAASSGAGGGGNGVEASSGRLEALQEEEAEVPEDAAAAEGQAAAVAADPVSPGTVSTLPAEATSPAGVDADLGTRADADSGTAAASGASGASGTVPRGEDAVTEPPAREETRTSGGPGAVEAAAALQQADSHGAAQAQQRLPPGPVAESYASPWPTADISPSSSANAPPQRRGCGAGEGQCAGGTSGAVQSSTAALHSCCAGPGAGLPRELGTSSARLGPGGRMLQQQTATGNPGGTKTLQDGSCCRPSIRCGTAEVSAVPRSRVIVAGTASTQPAAGVPKASVRPLAREQANDAAPRPAGANLHQQQPVAVANGPAVAVQ